MVDIGKRLRQLREERNLSQGDIERQTGLYRSYISRVEAGHMRPALATLERFAGALDVPLYWLFCDGTGRVPATRTDHRSMVDPADGTPSGPHARFLAQIQQIWKRMNEQDRRLLLGVAGRLAACRRAQRKTAPGPPRSRASKPLARRVSQP